MSCADVSSLCLKDMFRMQGGGIYIGLCPQIPPQACCILDEDTVELFG